MAKANKCDICRARKVKCDQNRPVCAQCSVKGRPCSYAGEKDEDDTALSLVAAKSQDAGSFHTLALKGVGSKRLPRPKVELSRPLVDESTRLRSRWIRMVGNTSSFGIFGFLLAFVPARIGSHPAVDSATAYVIQSHHMHKTVASSDTGFATKQRAQALATLRRGLATPTTATDYDGLLISIALHMVAEYLRGSLGDMIHYLHVGAICQLLRCRWARGRFEALDVMLIRAISGEEVLRAISAGEPSLLEDLPHLCTPAKLESVEAGEPEAISDVILSKFCCLPRLISLTRECANEPYDLASAESALAIATRIYKFKIEPLPFNTKERLTSDIDYISDLDDSVLDSWFDFESVFDFVVTLRYYSIRAMICGIIGRLAEFGVATETDFDLEAVANEELVAAENITKCFRYALDPTWDPAWPALRLPTALKISYGTWNRLLQGRSRAKSPATTLQWSASMKEFCARVSGHIGQVWYGSNKSTRLDEFSETCVGGPRLIDQRSPASALINYGLE